MVEGKSGGGAKSGKGITPSASKSYLARVLLHDNVSQQQLLDMKLSQIAIQQKRVTRMWDNHKKTFVYKQFQKQQQFRDTAVDPTLVRLVPPSVQKEYCLMVSETESAPLSERTKLSEHGLTLPPIEAAEKTESSPSPIQDPVDLEAPPAVPLHDAALDDSVASLEDRAAGRRSPTRADSVETPPLEVAAAKKSAAAKPPVELPPVKKAAVAYDEDVVNDKRFSDLFESLTGNFFTDAFGRHPLIA